jgi:Tfp pilus assembly protein PilZ
MDSQRTGNVKHGALALVGDVPEAYAAIVGKAAEMAQGTVHREPNVESALAWIEAKGAKPTAIGLWMDAERAARHAIAIRQKFELAAVPIIGIVRKVGDLAFEEAFASGIDDVSALDEWALGRRLRQLGEAQPGPVKRREETVVIADPDRDARLLIGRVFRDAGYTVAFAVDADEAVRQAKEPKTVSVISSWELEQEGESLAVRAGAKVAWIVSTPPKEIPRAQRRAAKAIQAGHRVAVHDAFAAAATLLFVANELVNKPGKDVRKSPRLLYGTSVRYRLAGRENEDVGYMYNVSEGGLYVRTMAPPDRGDDLWLEFTPPRSDRRVHLEAKTVWARRFGPSAAASVPPGFGVEISGGSHTDTERYKKSYEAFLAERIAAKDSILPEGIGS